MNHNRNQVVIPQTQPVLYNPTLLNTSNTLDRQVAVSTMKFGMLERIQGIKPCRTCGSSK